MRELHDANGAAGAGRAGQRRRADHKTALGMVWRLKLSRILRSRAGSLAASGCTLTL